MRKVRKDPMEIMGMKHPSEAAQLYVVKQNPEMIQFIGAPSERYSWRWSERMPP